MNRVTLLSSLLIACVATEPSAERVGSTERAAAVETLDQALTASGLPASTLLRQALVLGSESGWDVVQVPAWPQPGQPVRVVLVANSPRPPAEQARLRVSVNGWGSFRDAIGSVRVTSDAVPYVVFPPLTFPQPVDALFAVEVMEPWGSVWLNNGAADYAFSVAPAEPLTWLGDLAFSQGGLPRAGHGDTLFAGHGLTVTADTWPPTAGVDAVARWTVDGVVQGEVPLALEAAGTGPFGQNARWAGTLDTRALPVGAVVAVSVLARNAGAALLDNRGGGGHQLTVAEPPEVDWWQTGRFGFSECHWNGVTCVAGWQWQAPLDEPFDATPGQYQAGASMPYPAVEVFAGGLTDLGVGYEAVHGTFLQVVVASPFFSGDPNGPWLRRPITYRERIGNNLRYDWLVREFYHPIMPALGSDCPPDGTYPYRFEISTDGGQSFTSIGDGAFPDEGEDRTLVWQNFLTAPSLTTIPSNGLDLGAVAVGGARTGVITVVNTINDVLRLGNLATDHPAFQVRSAGCPQGGCEVLLAAGERIDLQVRFAPTAVGPTEAALSLTLERVGVCASTGTFERTLVGVGL
jgi:hypothetical protein